MVLDDAGFWGVVEASRGYMENMLSFDLSAITPDPIDSLRVTQHSEILETLTGRRDVAGQDRVITNATVIPNPIVCLIEGEGLVVSLASGTQHHPVYLKDSLLNDNEGFDSGGH